MESRRWLELLSMVVSSVSRLVYEHVFWIWSSVYLPVCNTAATGFLLRVESRRWLFGTVGAVKLVSELVSQYAVCVPKLDSLTWVLPPLHCEVFAKRIKLRSTSYFQPSFAAWVYEGVSFLQVVISTWTLPCNKTRRPDTLTMIHFAWSTYLIPPIYISIYPSIYPLSTYLSVYLFVCLSVCLSVCL